MPIEKIVEPPVMLLSTRGAGLLLAFPYGKSVRSRLPADRVSASRDASVHLVGGGYRADGGLL